MPNFPSSRVGRASRHLDGIVLGICMSMGCGGATVARVTPPLGRTITAIEVTEGGDALIVPRLGVTEVDVNSTIYLEMNEEEIAEEMTALASVEPGELAGLARRAELLDAVTRTQTALVTHLRALAANIAAQQPITAPELARLAALEQQVAAQVHDYAEETGVPASELSGEGGYRGIDGARARVLARSVEIASRVAAVRWRVQAGLAKDGMSVAIHLPNYDELPEEALRLVPKLGPGTPAGELRRQLDAAVLLSRSLDRLIAAQRALDQQVLVPLQSELRDLLQDDLATLDMARDDLAAHAGGLDEGQRLMAALEALRATLVAVQARCGHVLAGPGALVRADPSSLLDCVEVMRSTLDGTLLANVAALEAAVQSLQERIAARPRLRAALGEELSSVLEMLATYQQPDGPWRALAALVRGACRELAGPAVRTDVFTDRALAEITDTAIQLTRTTRAPDDVVFYRAALVSSDEPVEVGLDHTMRVVQAGLRLDVSAAVAFLRPFSPRDGLRGGPRDGEAPFRPAPAITAALHYHDWRGSDHHTGNRLWNFLDPGVGIHLAYPDLGVTRRDAQGSTIESDPAAELGVGGVVQLFGDLVQAGYGYDLQAGRAYWYIGLGLQTLTDLGISLPVRAGASER